MVLLFVLIVLTQGTAAAADRESPDYLLANHAGSRMLFSEAPLDGLYQKMVEAASTCYIGESDPSMFGVGGLAYELTKAKRSVKAERSADGSSAYIAIKIVGGMALMKTNIIQFDLKAMSAGTQVDIYYRRNVKLQRNSIVNAQAWLDGNWDFCELDPIQNRDRNRVNR